MLGEQIRRGAYNQALSLIPECARNNLSELRLKVRASCLSSKLELHVCHPQHTTFCDLKSPVQMPLSLTSCTPLQILCGLQMADQIHREGERYPKCTWHQHQQGDLFQGSGKQKVAPDGVRGAKEVCF